MRRFRLTLAVLIASCTATASIAAACEHCRHQGSKCSCKQDCDDRGLLGVVDRLAGNVQSGLKRSLPRIEVEADFKLSGKRGNCDQRDSGCGCELRPSPSNNCGCGVQPGQSHGHHGPSAMPLPLGKSPIRESFEAPPIPRLVAPRETPATIPDSITPPKPLAVPAVPRMSPPGSTPKPVSLPPSVEGQGLPDSMNDPFKDDNSASLRRQTPASPVNFERRLNRYVDSYDPQAAGVYRVKLFDVVHGTDEPAAEATSKVTTASASSPVTATGPATVSSRRAASPSQPSNQPSGQAALRHGATTPPPRPVGDHPSRIEAPASQGGTATYYNNPLR
jgi:hypothetical protein